MRSTVRPPFQFARATQRPDETPRQAGEPQITAGDPSWLRPFATAPNVRFTRTPEALIRQKSEPGWRPEPEPVQPEPRRREAMVRSAWLRPLPVQPTTSEPVPAAAGDDAQAGVPVAATPPGASAPKAGKPIAKAPPLLASQMRAARAAAAAQAAADLAARTLAAEAAARAAEAEAAARAEAEAAERATRAEAEAAARSAREAERKAKIAEARRAVARPQPVAVGRPAGNLPVAPATPLAVAAPAEVVIEDSDLLSVTSWPSITVRAAFDWSFRYEAPQAEIYEDEDEAEAEAAFEAAMEEEAFTGEPDGAEPEAADLEVFAADEVYDAFEGEGYQLPPLTLLTPPPVTELSEDLSAEALDKASLRLQQTLHDFGVRGEIIDANPGPVVTLYELEPAPGTKSSRVISLSNDIARSMSAVSARVAVVEGRNVIGIELPNPKRETVWLREMLSSQAFAETRAHLAVCLGKTIGGEPVVADLARMPHLLVAGTTGSGKSVAINTMILSLLYRLSPEQCRLIMIDPKMLELSVYEGIPHLLTPVVTDPRKAVVALKWAVREMEARYRKMSRLGVRNIDGYNARVAEAREKGEVILREVETGWDPATGQPIMEAEEMSLDHLPFIVVIVDEMADLMMVAGKDIEGAIQRLAQMARAAGIHIVMATQRPSVDVITGTIKANFPTRISFQVTSKIDSRTILGEQGAEHLLGQGDMLLMAGGGRIQRIHGPFVSDGEVEKVVDHLKRQGRPEYLDSVTASDEPIAPPPPPPAPRAPAEGGATGLLPDDADISSDVYEQAVAVVLRDRKASTSYVQRRLQIGYNRAASIMERMEQEGIVGPANHAGKREIFRDAPHNPFD